ncbi:MAG: NADH:flavin oxidoreductase [Paludibacteraceae bacterium]|nr:NADH:flavin oxidoreductase [Paludibacteraceae bacterium]
MNNSKLFSPYQLGPITLRNRIIRSAAFENMARHNAPTQQLQDYHVSVARGGVGMTTVAYCAVDLSGVSFDGQLYVRPEIIPDMRRMTDAIHAEGAKASIQLGHCGNMTHFYTCHCMPVSADTWFNLYSPTIHRRLRVDEIHTLVRKFGEAVDWARECGFDCVEIHAGHAYLISQFLSPRTNHRHDRYGGSFENRVRFLNEVLDEVMLHAKDDLAVVVKTNMWDDCWRGVSIEEGILVAKEIIKHGVHGLVLSGGTVSRRPMTILGGAMPYKTLAHYMNMRSFWWLKAALNIPGVAAVMTPTVPFSELYFMDQAKIFQEALKEELQPTTNEALTGPIALIYVGGVQSGDNCQQIMDEGFPLFQIAHVLIKDPDFVKHVQADPHYHAGCHRSNYCVGRMYSKDMKCHECVERDGEQIAPRIKREIAKMEAEAAESVEQQKMAK